MAQKCLAYTSTTKITSSVPAAAVICVPSYLLALPLCPDGESNGTYEYSTIEVTIVDVQCVPQKCGPTYYVYTLCFDAALIAEGQDVTTADILGIVDLGCLGQYINDKVGYEINLVDNGDGTLTLTSQHGCEFTFYGSLAPMALEYFETIDLLSAPQQVGTGGVVSQGFYIYNRNEEEVFLKLYHQALAPNPAIDVPVKTLPIPPDRKGATVDWAIGRPFPNGLWIRAVMGVAYTDTTDPNTNDVIVNIDYAGV